MIKIGDLICYNAAGQKKLSLGLVTNRHVNTANGKVKGVDVFYQIAWARRPLIMPRCEGSDPTKRSPPFMRDYGYRCTNWFKDGGWFEKITKQ